MPEEKPAVLILDDHALFGEALARLLQTEGEFGSVLHCGSVDDAIRTVGECKIDLVLLDYDLTGETGADFLRRAAGTGFPGKVIVVTAGVTDSEVCRLIDAGVAGIYMKHSSVHLLSECIAQVLRGQVWFEQRHVAAATEGLKRTAAAREPKALTDREMTVLRYVFEGLANKEIADRLNTSESAVKGSLPQLFSKTGVRTRSQLVRFALERYKDRL